MGQKKQNSGLEKDQTYGREIETPALEPQPESHEAP